MSEVKVTTAEAALDNILEAKQALHTAYRKPMDAYTRSILRTCLASLNKAESNVERIALSMRLRGGVDYD